MPKIGYWIIGLVIVGGLAWLFLSDTGKSIIGRSSSPEPAKTPGTQTIVSNRIQKNDKGTLSLVTISSTGSVIGSRELSFAEAVKLVGNVSNVCTGTFNVGDKYVECMSVRRS